MAETTRSTYRPPVNGALTEGQIRTYLEVRERQLKILLAATSGPRPVGGLDDLAVADLRAAQELSVNPREYSWVKSQVSVARAAEASRDLDARVKASFAPTVARLQEEERRLSDPVRKRETASEAAVLEARLSRPTPPLAPVVAANLATLAPYRDRLESLDRETARALAGAVGHRSNAPLASSQTGPSGSAR